MGLASGPALDLGLGPGSDLEVERVRVGAPRLGPDPAPEPMASGAAVCWLVLCSSA